MIATGIGFVVAFILWYSEFLRRVLEPYLVVLNSLPKIALGPIIIIWFGAGSLYYFFLNPLIVKAVIAIAENPIYDYFIGLVIGMMLVDLAYSLHLGLKVKKFSNNMVIKFEEFKVSVRVCK